MNKDKVQNVVLTLDDGTVVVLTGKAFFEKGDKRRILKIEFSEPRDLPDDYSWEEIPNDV